MSDGTPPASTIRWLTSETGTNTVTFQWPSIALWTGTWLSSTTTTATLAYGGNGNWYGDNGNWVAVRRRADNAPALDDWITFPTFPTPPPPPPPSPEQIAARQAVRDARVAANTRAEALLLSLLTERQLATYRAEGVIEGLTSGGRPYRLYTRRGISGNVEVLRARQWVTLCAHPPADLPTADVFVGQKLALENDEEHFLRTANVHRVRDAA